MRYIAFLRAINVGGHVVKMDALRARFERLGFRNVETFIASGNVVFEAGSQDKAAMERRIETDLETALGYEVTTFIRTSEQVVAIARSRPFPGPAMAGALALNVGLLKEPLSAPARQALGALATDIDDFKPIGSELYWMCARKQSESKISNAVLERALKIKATFRNLRTIERLAAKYPA